MEPLVVDVGSKLKMYQYQIQQQAEKCGSNEDGKVIEFVNNSVSSKDANTLKKKKLSEKEREKQKMLEALWHEFWL